MAQFDSLLDFALMSDQEIAVWYNDNVIYPDKVRQMIFATVLGTKIKYAGEEI